MPSSSHTSDWHSWVGGVGRAEQRLDDERSIPSDLFTCVVYVLYMRGRSTVRALRSSQRVQYCYLITQYCVVGVPVRERDASRKDT